MGIRFTCDHCQKRLNVKQSQGGQLGQCPFCDSEINVPLESTILPRRVKRKKKLRRKVVNQQDSSLQSLESNSIAALNTAVNAESSSISAHSDSRVGVQGNGTVGRNAPLESLADSKAANSNSANSNSAISNDLVDAGNSSLRVFEPTDVSAVTADAGDRALPEQRSKRMGTGFDDSHSDVGVLHDHMNLDSHEASSVETIKDSAANDSAVMDWPVNNSPIAADSMGFEDESDAADEIESKEVFNLSKPKLELDGKHPIRDFPNLIWYVRGKRLGEKGPLKGAEIEEMLEEGVRIKKGYIVWREDWIDWQPAELVFPELNQDLATRKALSDPNYRIPDDLNPHSEESRRRRFKKTFGIIAIGLSFVTIVSLSYVLIRMLG